MASVASSFFIAFVVVVITIIVVVLALIVARSLEVSVVMIVGVLSTQVR